MIPAKMPPIRFYLRDPIPADMPQSADVFWTGFSGQMRSGIYAWTVQTYLRLRDSGFPCELVTGKLPQDGIIVAHRKSLGRRFRPSPKALLVCLKADADFHSYAHLHVVLNRSDLRPWHPGVYLPHWPQAGLLPRAPGRGDAWKNAVFFGDRGSLAAEMSGPAWERTLRALELTWDPVEPARWNDFRQADVIVAVRSFDRQRYPSKPPTKLYNAWHAGVPAILGRELAYQHERQSPLDYLEAGSYAELVEALRRLQADPELRRAMVAHGRQRARESDPAVVTGRWRSFFTDVALPAHEQWMRAPAAKHQAFYRAGFLKAAVAGLQQKWFALTPSRRSSSRP